MTNDMQTILVIADTLLSQQEAAEVGRLLVEKYTAPTEQEKAKTAKRLDEVLNLPPMPEEYLPAVL